MSYFQQCQQSPLHYLHNAMPVDEIVVPGKFGYVIKKVPYIHPFQQLQNAKKQNETKEVTQHSSNQSTNAFQSYS